MLNKYQYIFIYQKLGVTNIAFIDEILELTLVKKNYPWLIMMTRCQFCIQITRMINCVYIRFVVKNNYFSWWRQIYK